MFILDMLTVLYKNEVTLLLNALKFERSQPYNLETADEVWEDFRNLMSD